VTVQQTGSEEATASCSATFADVDTYYVQAQYEGPNGGSSLLDISGSASATVNAEATTSLSLFAPSTVATGVPVTISAQVTPTGTTSTALAGSAVGFFSSSSDQLNSQGFLSGGSPMTCSQTLSNQETGYVLVSSSGQAQCTKTFATPGTYYLQATYGGVYPSVLGSNSNVVSITVQSPPGSPTPTPPPPPSSIPTSTTVSCSPNPATAGEQATCVATVSSQGGATPTGSVSFSGFGGVSMGSVTLVGGHGSVTVTTQATGGPLPVGSDTVTADYTPASGTGFEASSGNTTEVVNPVTSPVTSPTSPPTATAPPATSPTSTSTSTTPTTSPSSTSQATTPPSSTPPSETEPSSGTMVTSTVSEGPKPVRLVTGPGAAPRGSDPLEWSGVALAGLGLAGLAWSLFELLRGRRGRHV